MRRNFRQLSPLGWSVLTEKSEFHTGKNLSCGLLRPMKTLDFRSMRLPSLRSLCSIAAAMKLPVNWLIIPALALSLGACGEKEKPKAPAQSLDFISLYSCPCRGGLMFRLEAFQVGCDTLRGRLLL